MILHRDTMCSCRLIGSSIVQLVLWFSLLVVAQQGIPAGDVAPADQNYDFSSAKRCRVLAHRSVVLDNGKQSLLVIDGGFGSFRTTINGTQVKVLDLNPWTVAFDLTKDFSTPSLEPTWMEKKPFGPNAVPVTNHGAIWASADGSQIWYQGGHYFNNSNWSSSQWHVDKSKIPPWQLWTMTVTKHQEGWSDVTNDTRGHEIVNRTFGGAGVSVPKVGKSFYLGGLIDGTTSASTPPDMLQTTDQMLVYDHASRSLSRQKYYHSFSTEGVYQGDLLHLPIGSGGGYLISLMSLSKALNSPWVDIDGPNGNIELGDTVKHDIIHLYDIDAGIWIEQQTSWYKNQIPVPRTRFCSALFYDQSDNTWNLWVHGGQSLIDQSTGIREIYVLSMPSFIWSKLETSLPDTNLILDHTCHAVGGQLVIVGGYPPGPVVPANASCDEEYVKVLNIKQNEISWTTSFSTKTNYQNPQSVRDAVKQATSPDGGFVNQKLGDDFKYSSPSSSSNLRYILGGVIGGVAVLMLVLGILWWRCMIRRRRRNESDMAELSQVNSAPHARERPSVVVTEAALQENNSRGSRFRIMNKFLVK